MYSLFFVNFVFSLIGTVRKATNNLFPRNHLPIQRQERNLFAPKKNRAIDFFKFYILAVAFVFYISPYTSPSNPYYDCDSSAFYLIGKAIQQGMAPYKDIFDHKGPLLFYIYAWGEWLAPGKTGVFLLQTVNMCVILMLIYKLARLFTNATISAILLIFSMLCISACIGEGGLTEEWSLSLSMIALYAVIRHLLQNQAASLPSRTWILLGFTFGLHFLMRINNSATTCGLILALSIIILSERHPRILLRGLLLSGIGAAIPVAIFIIYIYKLGALADYIYSNFYFNAVYAVNGANEKSLASYAAIFMKLASLPFMLLIGTWLWKEKAMDGKVVICMFSVAIVSSISLIPGNNYQHYYMIYIPAILCALIMFSKFIIKKRADKKIKCLFLLLFLSLFASFIKHGFISIKRGAIITFLPGQPITKQRLLDSCKEFKTIISQNGGGSFLAYDSEHAYETGPEAYLYTGMLPCHKYFFAQSFHARIDPKITDSVNRCFKMETPPEWIVIRHSSSDINIELASIKSETVKMYLREQCERVAYGNQRPGRNDKAYSLYHRIR